MQSGNIPKMRKPLIIRFIGWLALFFMAWVPSMWLAEAVTGYQFQYFPFFAWLAFVFSMPLLLIWVLATIIYRVSEQRARFTAGEMMRLAREQQNRTPTVGR